MKDVVCPVHCGVCCMAWPSMPEIKEAYPHRATNMPCPHLGPTGCIQKRQDRPKLCLAFVCELASLAIAKQITPEQIARTIQQNMQDNACKYVRGLEQEGKKC